MTIAGRMASSTTGRVFACAFLAVYAASLLWVWRGDWQAIFLVWFVTLPFSLAWHEAGGLLQHALGMSDHGRAVVEAAVMGISGVIEFYALGALLAAGWAAPRPMARYRR